MQLQPLIGFAWRRWGQIQGILAKGHSSDKTSHIIVDALTDNAPWLKKYFPDLNDKGGLDKTLMDDMVETLKSCLLPPPPQTDLNNR